MTGRYISMLGFLMGIFLQTTSAQGIEENIQLGPRPFFLVEGMKDGTLKEQLQSCSAGPFVRTDFSIGHRGAPLQFPEHTRESYEAAARMGAGMLECDVTFTKDKELVCRHSQCDLHTTTDILSHPDLAAKCSVPFRPADPSSGREVQVKCCASDLTLSEFRQLRGKMDAFDKWAITPEGYMKGTADWRTDLYTTRGTLMTHRESVALFQKLGVKFVPELKTPEVPMPFQGTFSQKDFARKMISEYRDAGVAPDQVYPQSFSLDDIRFWRAETPEFGKQVVFLESRFRLPDFDPAKPETLKPTMTELAKEGLQIIAPPLWVLLTESSSGKMGPSNYAKAAREAGLDIIPWTLERSGPLSGGGGWYYQSVSHLINDDSDMLKVLDVLAREVGVIGVFSDWPATTSYYASCMMK